MLVFIYLFFFLLFQISTIVEWWPTSWLQVFLSIDFYENYIYLFIIIIFFDKYENYI